MPCNDALKERTGKSFRKVNTSACVLCSYTYTHAHTHMYVELCEVTCLLSTKSFLHVLESHTSTAMSKEGAQSVLSSGCSMNAALLCYFLGIDSCIHPFRNQSKDLEVHV